MHPRPLPRAVAVLTALLAAVLTLTACSSGSSPASGGTSGATQDTAFPVTLTHAFGETTIEKRPQRIVTLGVTDADPLLALGITPVAVTGYQFYPSGLGPWAEPLVQGAVPTRIASDSTPDVEQIAALRPDLILGLSAGFDESVYQRLAQIAPTIARPAGSTAYTGSRDEWTRTIARAVGRSEDGEQLIARTNAAFAKVKAEHPEFAGRTGAVVLPYDGRYGAFTQGDPRGALLHELGFTLPPALAALDTGERFFMEVSKEQVGLLDGDVLVMLADEPARRAIVDSDRVLAALPVVTEGRMLIGDTDLRGALSYNSVLSVPFALDLLVPRLADALAA